MEEMITFLSFLASRNPSSFPRRRESTRDLTSLPHAPSSFPRRRESTPSNQNHPQPDLSPYIYTKSGYDAVHHLFRVVTGLDSLVQGDHQVAGQVSRSFQALANVDKPADPVLSRMFHVAFRTGRTARKESGLGWSQVSIPSFGVKLLEREIGNLNGKSALLVGAGETGRITASSLMRSGIADMRIASRSQARSKGLADDMNAKSIPIQYVGHEMANVDIVITCTGATQNIILKKDIQQHIHNRSTPHPHPRPRPPPRRRTHRRRTPQRPTLHTPTPPTTTDRTPEIHRPSQPKSRNHRRTSRRRIHRRHRNTTTTPRHRRIRRTNPHRRTPTNPRQTPKPRPRHTPSHRSNDPLNRQTNPRRPHPNPQTPQPLTTSPLASAIPPPPPLRRGAKACATEATANNIPPSLQRYLPLPLSEGEPNGMPPKQPLTTVPLRAA